MKIFISGWLHHKNRHALEKGLGDYLTNNIHEADYVYSPSNYIDVTLYPNKNFVFGPHFSVFPDDNTRKLINNRTVYIQPSEWAKNVWIHDYNFNNAPIVVYPFGVDTEHFKPSDSNHKSNVTVYFKRRDGNDLQFVTNFLDQNNINHKVFSYGSYHENDYIEYLKSSMYCIWIGTHESQGFAFEECLSMNVPILVWDATKMSQEVGCSETYHKITTACTTCPYWDERCGEKFYNTEEFVDSFNNFVKNLKNYKPREYILDNLTIEKQSKIFLKLFDNQTLLLDLP
jgi:glycosyltransferase involved in cell wall biosynthesis